MAEEELKEPLTFGQIRVRTKFNPSADSLVDHIKQDTADIIDKLNNLQMGNATEEQQREFGRLKAIAMTKYEEAVMFAVKAMTT